MKIQRITRLCAWYLGIFFFCAAPTCTEIASNPLKQEQQQVQTQNTPSTSPQQILQELVKADVVYLGETHTSAEDHQVQLEILQALYQNNQKIAVAMEMFQRPYQEILDQYLAGKITEAQLVEQSEYEQRWGFAWEYYAPMLRFAKAKQLPVIALNAPTEVTRKVARNGIESLTVAEQRYIPPLSEIRTDNDDYRQIIKESYAQHNQAGHGNSDSLERFFTVQVLWDETMADSIAQFIKANPDYQVVVIAGQGHIVYGYGIPSRVARRFNNQLQQRTVLLGASAQEQVQGEKKIADFFWPHR
ncbi:MAG: ChaN family lipoprotein [Symploca sp. SIO2B6]|nr:ChaN family lipoprotein [Symploca sp. SIO2B6]